MSSDSERERCFGKWERTCMKERNEMWKRGSLVSMVYRNWQTNKASVMSKIWKKKKKEKKRIEIAQGRWRIFGFDFVLSPGWRNSRSSHLPVWKDLEESDSLCQRKKKRGKEGLSHGSWSGGREREGGQVGIVSPVPLSIHPPWFLFGLLGPMVTKEGVRNVLLLWGCHLRTEGSFVCGALRGWRNSTGPGISGRQHSRLNINGFGVLKRRVTPSQLSPMLQQCMQCKTAVWGNFD